MTPVVRTIFFAAATWLVSRWLRARAEQSARAAAAPRPVERWENEGGAVLPPSHAKSSSAAASA